MKTLFCDREVNYTKYDLKEYKTLYPTEYLTVASTRTNKTKVSMAQSD